MTVYWWEQNASFARFDKWCLDKSIWDFMLYLKQSRGLSCLITWSVSFTLINFREDETFSRDLSRRKLFCSSFLGQIAPILCMQTLRACVSQTVPHFVCSSPFVINLNLLQSWLTILVYFRVVSLCLVLFYLRKLLFWISTLICWSDRFFL